MNNKEYKMYEVIELITNNDKLVFKAIAKNFENYYIAPFHNFNCLDLPTFAQIFEVFSKDGWVRNGIKLNDGRQLQFKDAFPLSNDIKWIMTNELNDVLGIK